MTNCIKKSYVKLLKCISEFSSINQLYYNFKLFTIILKFLKLIIKISIKLLKFYEMILTSILLFRIQFQHL